MDELYRKLLGWNAPIAPVERTAWTGAGLPSDPYELEQYINEAHSLLMQYDGTLGWYLKQRGVHNRIQPQYLGYMNGWYTIPVYDDKKSFLGAVARACPHVQESSGKRFDIPQGQKALVYVPDWSLVHVSDYLVVVYGIIDALALCELRIPVCTPTAGKLSMHAGMLDWCRKRIIVVPDKGEEDTALTLIRRLGWRGIALKLAYPDGAKDPADLLVSGYGEWLRTQIVQTTKGDIK